MKQTTPTTSLLVRDSGNDVVIYDPDNDDAWIRSDQSTRTRWER